MSTQIQQMVGTYGGMGDEAFVQKGYLTFLGRSADPVGLKDYVGRLRAGVQRTQIWSELAGSDEARRFAGRQIASSIDPPPKALGPCSLVDLLAMNGVDFVQQAYRVVLGREADPTGLRQYTERLAAGVSKSQLLADMRCDPEGQAHDSKFEGLDDWVKLVQRQASVANLLAIHGELFVYAAYVALFQREPDPEGLARYMSLLKSGASRTFVLMELLNSREAREKSASLRGLVSAVALYKKAQRRSLRGWYCRNVLGAESDLPADQERRALAYRLRCE